MEFVCLDEIYKDRTAKDWAEAEKRRSVEHFKMLNQIWGSHRTMEACIECSEYADFLHKKYGFTYDELEQFEIEAIKNF